MYKIKDITAGFISTDAYDTVDDAIAVINEYMHADEVMNVEREYSIINSYGMTVFHSHSGTVKSIKQMLTVTT